MRLLFIISFLLVCYTHIFAQKDFSNFMNVYSEAERVTDSFVYHHPTEDFQIYTEIEVKIKDIDYLIEVVETKRSKRPVIEVKDFQTLDQQELRLFQILNKKYGNEYKTRDLYYSIILYWLLPHRLCHQIKSPIKEDNYQSYSRFVLDIETLVDKMTYKFMVASDLHEELPSFYSLVSEVIQYTKPKDVVYVSEIFERPLPMNELAKRFYLNASTMQLALDELISGKEKKFESPIANYDESQYQSEAEQIVDNFKKKYHSKDEDDWIVQLESSEYESDLVQYYWKSHSKIIDIKSYNSLQGSEEEFLKDVQTKYGNEDPTIDFYYKLIHNWLLPQNLLKLTLHMNQVSLEENDKELHQMTLVYMSENGLLKQIEDFNKLCRTIVVLTEQQRTKEQLTLWEDKPFERNIQYSIYKYAKQMTAAIDDISRYTRDQ